MPSKDVKTQNVKKRRVCILAFLPYGAYGGVKNVVYDLSKALSKNYKNEMDVMVVCTGINKEREIPENVQVFPILSNIDIRYLGLPISIFLSMMRLLLFISKHKPDIIHAHPVWPSGFIALVSKFHSIPLVCTSHGDDIQKNEETDYGVRNNPIISRLVKFTLRRIDLHIVVSESMIDFALDAGSSRSRLMKVYNGIDVAQIPENVTFDILTKYGLSDQDFIILFLGRLHIVKSPQDLLNAFVKVVMEIPNARLVFAGRGDQEKKLKNLATTEGVQDKVIFTGFLSGEDKWTMLMHCDIFVLPSVLEAFGITPIEAMACGKPVITTNIGSFKEIVRNNKTGILVRLHSPNDIAKAITFLFNNPERRQTMGEEAKKYVKKNFSINKVAQDYKNIYDKLLNLK